MDKHTHRPDLLSAIILMVVVSLSCSLLKAGPSTPTPAGSLSPEQATATTVSLLQASDGSPGQATPYSPGQQEIELRFIDPGSQEECVAHFPFEILGDSDQHSISGSGVLDCHFEVQQCGEGVCVTYHSTYYLDGELSGAIRESTSSYPDGALEAGLAGTFTMKQYWTDIPPETVMAYTEANPFEVSSSDIIPLFFHLVDGATQEVGNAGTPDAHPWVFILHLE